MCRCKENENKDDEKETICPEVIHPEDLEECVGDEKDDNNNIINDEIEVTCLDVTPPDSMDRGAAEEKKTMIKK